MTIEEQYEGVRDDIFETEAFMLDDNPYAYLITLIVFAVRLRLRLNPWFFV